MIVAFLIGILDEEHIVNHAEKSILQTLVLLGLLLGCEIFLNFLLCVDKGLQTVTVTANAVEEELLGLLAVFAEEVR